MSASDFMLVSITTPCGHKLVTIPQMKKMTTHGIP